MSIYQVTINEPNNSEVLVSGLRGRYQITLQSSTALFLTESAEATSGILFGNVSPYLIQFEALLDSADEFYGYVVNQSATVTVMVNPV